MATATHWPLDIFVPSDDQLGLCAPSSKSVSFDHKQAFDAVNGEINEILAGFAVSFASAPSEQLDDVLAHVDNA